MTRKEKERGGGDFFIREFIGKISKGSKFRIMILTRRQQRNVEISSDRFLYDLVNDVISKRGNFFHHRPKISSGKYRRNGISD